MPDDLRSRILSSVTTLSFPSLNRSESGVGQGKPYLGAFFPSFRPWQSPGEPHREKKGRIMKKARDNNSLSFRFHYFFLNLKKCSQVTAGLMALLLVFSSRSNGRQRGDWRFHCSGGCPKESDCACHWP